VDTAFENHYNQLLLANIDYFIPVFLMDTIIAILITNVSEMDAVI